MVMVSPLLAAVIAVLTSSREQLEAAMVAARRDNVGDNRKKSNTQRIVR
jgi:hypothetical protein